MGTRKREVTESKTEVESSSTKPTKSEGSKSFDTETKIKKIQESKMPEEQKQEYIRSLQIADAKPEAKVPFSVYCKVKKVPARLHEAMKAYPAAKGVKLAPLAVWEDIYTNF